MEAEELSIQGLLKLLKKWLPLLLIVPVSCALIAGVILYRFTPSEYTANVTLYVMDHILGSTGNPQIDALLTEAFALDYVDLFERSPVMQRAQLALEVWPIEENIAVEVANIPDTSLLEIRVTGTDAQLAADAANTIARLFQEYLEDFILVSNVSITREATVPTVASGPYRSRNTAFVGAVALFLTISAILIISLIDTRINTRDQVLTLLKMPLLGAVPDYRRRMRRAMRQGGLRGAPLLDAMPERVRESIRTLSSNLLLDSVDSTAPTIALSSRFADEGADTLTYLAALQYASEGRRTILIDLDARASTLTHLSGAAFASDLVDCARDAISLEDAVYHTPGTPLDLLGIRQAPKALEEAVSAPGFDALMQRCRQRYDVILFTAPPLGLFADLALVAAQLNSAALVLGRNQVHAEEALMVLRRFDQVHVHVSGAVLNHMWLIGRGRIRVRRKYERAQQSA